MASDLNASPDVRPSPENAGDLDDKTKLRERSVKNEIGCHKDQASPADKDDLPGNRLQEKSESPRARTQSPEVPTESSINNISNSLNSTGSAQTPPAREGGEGPDRCKTTPKVEGTGQDVENQSSGIGRSEPISSSASETPPHSEPPDAQVAINKEAAPSKKARGRELEDREGRQTKRARIDEIQSNSAGGEGQSPSAKESAVSEVDPKSKLNGASSFSNHANDVVAPKHSDSQMITDAQQKYLLERIRKAKKTKNGMWFAEPVDPEKMNVPTYYDLIKNPMDLSTIEQNLRNKTYNSTDHMMQDFDLMVKNCVTFNGPQHQVTQAGYDLKAYFIKVLEHLPPRDQPVWNKSQQKSSPAASRPPQTRRESRSKTAPVPAKPPTPSKPTALAAPSSSNTFALDPNGVPLIRRDSNPTDRPKREIHRPPPRDLPYSTTKPKKKKYALELRFAEKAIAELFKAKHKSYAFPFLQPVDPVALNIPDYHKVIKKPMDFQTISRNLKSNFYGNAKEVHADATQVFMNCFKYNAPKSPVNILGRRLQEVFETEWARKDSWIIENTPVSEPEPQPSEEEMEEEPEPEPVAPDPRTAKLLAIQEQIAKLTEQSNKLIKEATQTSSAGNSHSPKPSALPKKLKKEKKGRESSGAEVKKVKKASLPASVPSQKKSTGRSQTIPIMTVDQKRELAEFITTMDSGSEEMAYIISMIKSGMPKMNDHKYDLEEIEISVDDIPNHIVYELYQYIRQLQGLPTNSVEKTPTSTKHVELVPDVEYDARDEEDSEYQPRPKKGSGRSRRFEKVGRGAGRPPGGLSTGDEEDEASSALSVRRKKNKPMKPQEQESKIQEVTATLAMFQQGNNSDSAGAHVPHTFGSKASLDQDSSEDESDSESEEE